MKTRLVNTIFIIFIFLFFQSVSFSEPLVQIQDHAIVQERILLGENQARDQLIPTSNLSRFQILDVDDDYHLRVIYMIPSNRSPQQGAEEKLQHYVLRMQKWFSDNMEVLGYGSKTFQYEMKVDGVTPLVNIVHVDQLDIFYHGTYGERWSKVLNGIADAGYPPWQRGELMLVISEMQIQVEDGSFLESSLFVGGAGTNFSGVGMVTGDMLSRLSEIFLTDDRLYDGLIIPEIGSYPLVQNVSFPWFEGKTISSISSSAQGATLHELAHGLGLWHDFRNDLNFNGNLMGNGLRGMRGAILPDLYPSDDTRLAAGSALQMNHSRFFNTKTVFIEDNPPQVQILSSGIIVPQGGLCQLEFTASDAESSLGGAILIRAGHVVAEMSFDKKEINNTISTYDYVPGIEDEWHLLVFDKQGNKALSAMALVTCAEGYNRAPIPFINVNQTRVQAYEEVTLSAINSSDPDGNNSQLKVEWDLDGDGNYDINPSLTKIHSTIYTKPGIYQIIARLTDEHGDSSLSMPIGIRVEQPLVISVDIDIKPHNKRNVVNIRSKGGIWVAILSSDEFDSQQVNIKSVRFGSNEASVIRYRVRDINKDGYDDLLLRFKIPKTGIKCGDTEAMLTGKKFDSQSFTGTDAIKTLGCKQKKHRVDYRINLLN